MDTDKKKIIHEEKTFHIIGCAMNVMNILGHGFLEKVYENALTVEFREKNIPFAQQPRYAIHYKDMVIGEYIPDLVAYDEIILDTKVIDKITNVQKAQMINYLKTTNRKVGIILNFKNPRLEWERIIL